MIISIKINDVVMANPTEPHSVNLSEITKLGMAYAMQGNAV